MLSIQLSGCDFAPVDFSESVFVIDPEKPLPENLSIPVWGALLLTSVKNWGKDALTIKSDRLDATAYDLTVCGYGYVDAEGVSGATLEIYPYDAGGRIVLDKNGKPLVRRFDWSPSRSGQLFDFEMTVAFPYGYGVFHLWAASTVSFRCDLNDCVTFPDWLANTEKYKWPGWQGGR